LFVAQFIVRDRLIRDFSQSVCICIPNVMEWLNENVLLLIEKYRESELLWNAKRQFYYYKIKKNDAWEEIASEFNTTAEEVKKKINTLLSALRREKMNISKSLVTGRGTYSYNFFLILHKFNFLLIIFLK